MVNYLDEIDFTAEGFGDLYDELPLWSAPSGLMLLDRIPMRGGLTILDVGAGTGYLSIELAERCGAASRVIAVDPWHAGVERLRRKIEQRRIGNVTVIEQDAAALDLPPESVDVIVSSLGLNNYDDPDAVLRACWRAAKPGARLFLTTTLIGQMAEFYNAYRATLSELDQRDRLSVLRAHIYRRGSIESVAGIVEAAGFKVGETTVNASRLRFADGSALLRHYFIRLGFVPGWKSVVAEGMAERTFELLERKLNSLAEQQGELSLTIPLACLVAEKGPRPA